MSNVHADVNDGKRKERKYKVTDMGTLNIIFSIESWEKNHQIHFKTESRNYNYFCHVQAIFIKCFRQVKANQRVFIKTELRQCRLCNGWYYSLIWIFIVLNPNCRVFLNSLFVLFYIFLKGVLYWFQDLIVWKWTWWWGIKRVVQWSQILIFKSLYNCNVML